MNITKSTLVRLNVSMAQFFTWGDKPRADIVTEYPKGVLNDRFSISYAGFRWVVPARGLDEFRDFMGCFTPKSPVDIRATNEAILNLLDRLEAELV